MSDVTHRLDGNYDWAVCGAIGPHVVFVDGAPTCLGCAANTWTAIGYSRNTRVAISLINTFPKDKVIPDYVVGVANSDSVEGIVEITVSTNTLVLGKRT